MRPTIIAAVLAVSLIGISMSVAYADRPAGQQPTTCPSMCDTAGPQQMCPYMGGKGDCSTDKGMGRHCPLCRHFTGPRLMAGAGLVAVVCLVVITLRLRKINKTLEKIAKKLGPPPPTA